MTVPLAAGPLSERILFVSNPTGKDRIYIMRSDGRDLERFLDLRANANSPSLSEAAQAVAFQSDLEGRWQIYRVDLLGENLQRLTHTLSNERHPSWSPDGQRIVFQSSRWGQPELATMNADGSNPERITWDQMVNTRPIWSPTGEWIAYVSYRGGSADLWAFNLETHDSLRLTYNSIQDTTPAWSPDGKRLVYQSRHYWGTCLALVDLDEPHRQVEFAKEYPEARDPVFSPDGRYVLFSNPAGLYRVELVDGVPQPAVRQEVGAPSWGQIPEFRDLEWARLPLPW